MAATYSILFIVLVQATSSVLTRSVEPTSQLGHAWQDRSGQGPRPFQAGRLGQQGELLLHHEIDSSSCGCALPEQFCEVPVPQAELVGIICPVGQFCCKRKRIYLPKAQIKPNHQSPTAPTGEVSHTKTFPKKFTNQKVKHKHRGHVLKTGESNHGVLYPVRADVSASNPVTDSWRFLPGSHQLVTSNKTEVTNRPLQEPDQVEEGENHQSVVKKEDKKKRKITPQDLGLPEGAAYIRPVGQDRRTMKVEPHQVLNKRRGQLLEEVTCRCRRSDLCSTEHIDLTFGKSCPYGQVKCCSPKVLEDDAKEPIEVASKSPKELVNRVKSPETTTKVSSLENSSNFSYDHAFRGNRSEVLGGHAGPVRPINIPVTLVPNQPAVQEPQLPESNVDAERMDDRLSKTSSPGTTASSSAMTEIANAPNAGEVGAHNRVDHDKPLRKPAQAPQDQARVASKQPPATHQHPTEDIPIASSSTRYSLMPSTQTAAPTFPAHMAITTPNPLVWRPHGARPAASWLYQGGQPSQVWRPQTAQTASRPQIGIAEKLSMGVANLAKFMFG